MIVIGKKLLEGPKVPATWKGRGKKGSGLKLHVKTIHP